MSFLNKLCLILLFGIYCEAQKPSRKEAYMSVTSWYVFKNAQSHICRSPTYPKTPRLLLQKNGQQWGAVTCAGAAFTCCKQIRTQLIRKLLNPRLIRAAGYPAEKHRVTTPDGYTLLLYRIPAGRRSARRTGELNAKGKKAILILHGLGGGSSNFVIMGPKRSIAYLLADAGYDVWLANLRGTAPTTHMNLTRSDEKFWDFSFHEHGKYDVPVLIDRILNVTGLEKIMCLGHSLGTTNFFTMISLKPEYNNKLIAFVALGPAVYLDHLKPVVNLAFNTLEISKVFRARGWWAIYPQLLQSIQANFCNQNQPRADFCKVLLDALFGDNSEQYDAKMAPIYLYRTQALSWSSIEHYAKIAMTGAFTTFSGGMSGPVIPYNISNVKIPVSLLYGENDRFIDKSDIQRLKDELKAYTVLEDVRPVLWHNFNHVDFVFAKDVRTLVNKPLVKHIDKLYNKYGPV